MSILTTLQTRLLRFGQTGTGKNWSKEHDSEGSQLIGKILDVVKKEAK